jgi:hypothetical protein
MWTGSPFGFSVHSVFSICRVLFASSALAASRMVWVER